MTSTAIINARSRNLGFGFNTQPVQRWNHNRGTSYLVVPPPSSPSEIGGPRTIEEGIKHMRRIVSGGVEHSAALFVGDRRVIAARVYRDFVASRLGPDWEQASISDVILALREGAQVEVRLADEESE